MPLTWICWVRGIFDFLKYKNSLSYNFEPCGYTKFKFAHFFWQRSSGII